MPLSHTKGRKGQITFGWIALEQRHRQAVLIAQSIGIWAHVEASLGGILASFLRADATVSMEMYAALRGFSDQRRMLEVAANTVLPSGQRYLILDLLNAIQGMADNRNQFAHRVWGICESLPDDILLLDPKIAWRLRGRAHDYLRELDGEISIDGLTGFPTLDRRDVQVWSILDLARVKEDLILASHLAQAVDNYFSGSEDGPSRDFLLMQIYDQLIMQNARNKRLRQGDRHLFSALPIQSPSTDVY